MSRQNFPRIWIFSYSESFSLKVLQLNHLFVPFFHLNIAVCLPWNVFPFARSEWWKLLESFPSIVLTKNRQKSWKVKVCWNLFEMFKCVCMYQAHKLMYLTCDFSSDIESQFYLVRNHIFLYNNHSIWIKQNDKKNSLHWNWFNFARGENCEQIVWKQWNGVHTTWKKYVKTHLEMKTFLYSQRLRRNCFPQHWKICVWCKKFFCAF